MSTSRARVIALADDVDRDGLPILANILRAAARGDAVVLPTINRNRDDLGYWRGVADVEQLRQDAYVDLWNAAAGLDEINRREAEAAAKLALDVAAFTGQVVAS